MSEKWESFQSEDGIAAGDFSYLARDIRQTVEYY